MGTTQARRRIRVVLAAALGIAALTITSAAAPAPIVSAALDADPSHAIAGGQAHQCAVLSDQTVQCWGENDRGQLGDGTTTPSLTPVPVTGLTDVVAIDAGLAHTCALTALGTVGCWGRNTSGSLGDPGAASFETAPTFANGLTDVVEIAVGGTHSCARVASGGIFCWGDNDDDQLGDGTGVDTAVPVAVAGVVDAIQVSAGLGTTCAIRAAGSLVCWGFNSSGMFGNGTTTSSAVPITVDEAGQVEQVEVGAISTCIIADTGHARCSGFGPLGDGTNDSSDTFVDVDLPPVLDISVGGDTCAIVPDASVWCWGSQAKSLDGRPTEPIVFGTMFGNTPQPVPDAEDATSIDAMPVRTCIGTIAGRVECWGANVGGELQIEAEVIAEPGTIVDGVTATQLAVEDVACGVTPAATVTCWGIDFSRAIVQSTLDDLFTFDVSPVPVDGVADVVDLDNGPTHTCAARVDGSVLCWGFNLAGELGFPAMGPPNDPDLTYNPPAVVDGVSNATEVALGFAFTCTTPSNTGACWGMGDSGQLGNGSTPAASSTPSPVVTPQFTTNVDLIAAADDHACARLKIAFFGIFLHCWGDNANGELGDGTQDDRSTPVNTGIVTPKSVAVAVNHSCAIDGNADVYCWGGNDVGQVDSTNAFPTVLSPHAVAGIATTPTQVAVGNDHSCALLADTTVTCWGSNLYGQSGQPNPDDEQPPTVVPGLTGVTHIAAGQSSTCAVLADATVTCWGRNLFGITGELPYVTEPTDMGIGSLVVPSVLRTEPIFRPVDPSRLLDTRANGSTIDDVAVASGRVPAGTQVEVQISGRAGVPADATFAVVNVTAVKPSTTGFVTAHPCLTPPPLVAQLNYSAPAGVGPINLGNESIVELSSTGTLCLFSSSETDLTADIVGYGTDRGGYAPVTPARILESRSGQSTIDGQSELGVRLSAGTEVTVQVSGRADIPENATAAVLYVAAVRPSGVGFATVHPCEDSPPLASSLNFGTLANGQTVSRGNEIVAPLDDSGAVCIFVSETTDLTVDVMGSIGAATTYKVRDPVRILESRAGLATIDGQAELGARLATGAQVELSVAGRADVPTDASTATLNITAIKPDGVGFVTAHPCVSPRPTASSLNFTTTPIAGPINGGNEIVAPLSATGTVCLYVSQSTHLSVDLTGWS